MFGFPNMKAICEQKSSVGDASFQLKAETGSVDYSCEIGTGKYYAICSLAGIIACGPTHFGMTPVDVVKCRIQAEPSKYRNTFQGFRVTVTEEGLRGLAKGWSPTLIGYSMQGFFKFGLYEVFKDLYKEPLSPESFYLWRTSVYLAASASAEFFADIALAPMEACKVRIQTQPGYANNLREAFPKMLSEEGLGAFYKGLPPLWMRQIPYTMIKFSCFERIVEAMYKNLIPKPKSECSIPEQMAVTFTAGYIAGIICATASHPPDSVVSYLNKDVGSSPSQALRNLGLMGIWKGLPARIFMVGTLTAAQWLIYDFLKVYFRVPRPPPPEMPESIREKLLSQ